MKGINLSRALKWTAWIINVDGIGNKDTLDLCIHTLLPSKGSSFSGEGRGEGWERGGKKQTETCVSGVGVSVRVTFCFCHWNTSSLLSQSHKIKQAEDELQQTQS